MKHMARQIAEITDHLYLCGINSITGPRLEELGITHVLNLAVELSEYKYPLESLTCLRLPLRDNDAQEMLSWLDQCFDFIIDAKNEGGKTLVHCVAGVSRSASVCLAYLVKYENMSLKDAFSHVKEQRPGIYPNSGFWNQLIDFEIKLRGDNSVEIRPYIFGTVPELDPSGLSPEVRFKLQTGWINELLIFYGFHLFLLIVQVIVIALG